MRQKLKQCIAMILLGIVIMNEIPVQTFAETQLEDRNDTGNTNSSNGIKDPTDYSTKTADAYLRQRDIGLRIYVTDAYGNVKQTDKGYDAIDFLYEELMDKKLASYGYNGSSYLRCTANPKQGYNIGRNDISTLGFSPYTQTCNRKHGNGTCDCTREYFVDMHYHGISGTGGRHVLREKLFTASAGEKTKANELLYTYWTSTVNEYVSEKEKAALSGLADTTDIELYMHVEVTFAIIHHATAPNTPTWYGSLFEFGCFTDAQNHKKIKPSNQQKYESYDDDYWHYLPAAFYIDEPFECFSDFTYMKPATPDKTILSTHQLYCSEIENQAYGMYSMSFGQIVRTDIKTDKTEIPVSGDIEVKKEEATTISKVQNEDVEIRTGYAAQNGYYDIGVDSGIPTTEEIRNVIEAQDCIIDYAYVYEKYVPEKFPTVTYTFDYYVPCTCPEETHEEDDYGYDENGNYVVTGSHTVVDKPYGHHGNSYHTASGGYNGSSVLVKEFEIPRAVTYYRITDYKIYGLDNVTVYNECSNAAYGSLSPVKSVTAVISGKTNPTDITKTALDTHADFSQVKNLSFTHTDINGKIFSNRESAQNWIDTKGFEYGDKKMAVPKAANDSLIIEFKDSRGKVELMNNKWCERPEMNEEHVVVTPTPTRSDIAKKDLQKIYRDERENLEIPYGLMNGNYYTTIHAFYSLYAGTDKYDLYAWYHYDAAPDHIIDESFDLKTSVYNSKPNVNYASQEPIHVITPVISPFHTDDSSRMEDLTDEEKNAMTEDEIKEYEREQSLTGTQLVNEADCQQLRVDETYTLTFDPAMHQVWLGYGYSGLIDNENYWNGHYYEGELLETDNKYDKYVAKKFVKFPFDVYIQNILFAADTWICVYEYDKETDTVSAGDITTPLLLDVEYYIPSWAVGTIDNTQQKGMIETMVHALNYNGGAGGTTYNPKDEETWSRNAINVQLSGWVYDFKITGTNEMTPWIHPKEYKLNTYHSYEELCISFSDRKEERYMGIYNRLGEDNSGNDKAQRRDKDNSLDTAVSEETDVLPLSFSSSRYGIEQGTLKLGSEFGFTLKTMDTLSDTDKIVITPTFTYYSSDMSKVLTMDDMELYYTNSTTKNKYASYGTESDVAFLVNDYRHAYNTGIFTTDEIIYTAKNNSHADTKWFQGLSDLWIKYRAKRNTVNIGSLSEVTLTDWCMIYSEPLSELKLAVEELDTVIDAKSGDIAVIVTFENASERFTTKAVAFS